MDNIISKYSALVDQAIYTLPLQPSKALSGLYTPIAYGLDTGGKRLRPVLTLLAGTAYGKPIQEIMPAALAIEMFHNFTLLHDDVMDNSPTRRGKPSVHKKWDANTAILSGDTLYGLCYNQLLQLPENILHRALRCFNKTAIEVFEGQQYDMDFEKRQDVSISEYLEMIRLKTSVLLGGAAALGAIAANADSTQVQAWYKYGEALGLAFQIQDDLLDVYGDSKTFGKPIGGDILNAKKTYLLISALNNQNISKNVKEALLLPADTSRIEAIRNLYDKADIPTVCNKAIAHHTQQAIDALNSLAIPENYHDTLKSLALSLAHRSK